MLCIHNQAMIPSSWHPTMATIDESWKADIESKVNAVDPSAEEELWKKLSIWQVPAFARNLNPKIFTPQVASFGPYHHNKHHLKPMEVHKERALVHFLKRARRPLDDFATAVSSVVQQLQDSYYSLNDEWKDGDRFLKLMIVDGCFMLEVLRLEPTGRGYAHNDPFFSRHAIHHKVPYIRRDMLMLENQLPLLLLKKLVAVESPQTFVDDNYINNLAIRFLADKGTYLETTTGLGLHPLDLFRQSLLQIPPTSTKLRLAPPPPRHGSGISHTILTAFELHEAGVSFTTSSTTSLKDISFSRNGVLSLPHLLVDDATECIFLNIVAFEHLHVATGNEVTSYISFMDEIIDSAKDVSLLNSSGIIQNSLGSDEAVANLFNCLSKEVTLDPEDNLGEVRREVHRYCQKRWNKWRANLLHTYFRNPWSSLSLAGAMLVIVLTVSQTVYSVLQYYHC